MIHIDIETYSRVNLKNNNVYRYSEDEDFTILMAGFSVDDSPVDLVFEDDIYDIPGLWDPDVLKVAHNAAFERVCLSRFKKLPPGTYLPSEEFRDTMAIAAELGLPRSLDGLSKALGVAQKDSAGKTLINFFCKPDRNGNRRKPEDHPEKWLDFCEYCVQDVVSLKEIDAALGDWPTETEEKLFHVDQRINDRGMRVDMDLVRKAVEAADENLLASKKYVSDMTGIENPNSRDQMLNWFRQGGAMLKDLTADTVKTALSNGELTDVQKKVLLERQSMALSAPKKFQAALDQVSFGGRLRGSFRFFGAHTGRWAGRGVQVQNLPREAFKTDEEVDFAIADLKMGFGASTASLKRLVRPMFIGPLAVCDYSAIEARVVAWLAGEDWVLEAFRQGRDIYVETAERMSTTDNPMTRFDGKVAVLALGYNGGAVSLFAMGYKGAQDDAEKLVKQWRRANKAITRYWTDLEEAFVRGRGAPGAGFVKVERDGDDRILRLPSGRGIHYRDVRVGKKTNKWGGESRDISFADTRYGRGHTYGGRLTENVTQAVARDVVAEALISLDAEGYLPVGHVHDEVIVELEAGHNLLEIQKIMDRVPSWAPGLPIASAGYESYRYKKD